MKIAIYARVSKDEASSDGRLQDPKNQIVPLKKFAGAMGWQVKYIYVDRASGGDSNRPQFQEMMSHVRQRHYDLILVWSLDRFSREGVINTLSYIEQLKKYKTALKSLQEQWMDTTEGGIGELLVGIFAWMAQQERLKISERTKAGLRRARQKGVKLGRPSKK